MARTLYATAYRHGATVNGRGAPWVRRALGISGTRGRAWWPRRGWRRLGRESRIGCGPVPGSGFLQVCSRMRERSIMSAEATPDRHTDLAGPARIEQPLDFDHGGI